MRDPDPEQMARLQAVVTAMIHARVASSLAELDGVLARWRSGELGALEAHGAVLRHAARCERLVERVTKGMTDRPAAVIRDAVDAGLLDEDGFVALIGRPSAEVEPAHTMRLDDHSARDKRSAVEELLDKGAVLVHVDSRRPEVEVPPHLAGNPRLVLRFGYRLSPAIVDLAVDEHAISGTLTFGGRAFFCRLPWAGVYAAVVEGEERGMVWPEDIPAVLRDEDGPAAAEADAAPGAPEPTAADRARRPSEADGKKARPSHLKLVD
ncbi:MAG: hypothetical protein KBG28_25310 [Kofleriaceae bacterium]|nr:hypothetical protein [Kofleriaceae bacterium]MBP6839580.1 hypothetical protein [Kofleriaceae bacterium]MBP9207313.1 hypothetical protein [Kofleriaceae bacterium]